MKSINLFWYKLPDGSSNYGDELNYFIVRELSGRQVNHIPYPYKWYKVPLIYLNNKIKKRGYVDFKGMLRSVFARKILFAIGSVLQIYDRNGIIIWGAGIIQNKSRIHKATFKAVRGLETVKRLKELGYDAPSTLGDPALLLPLLVNHAKKKYKVGIAPNFRHYEECVRKLNLPSACILIDLKDGVQSVTDQITSCEYILATSLHGLIVAHAFNIPALWVDLKLENKLAGDDIKFRDYFSSVDIDPYLPVAVDAFNLSYIENLMSQNSNKILIKNDLNQIQRSLLKSFPFTLKKKYQF